MDTTNQDRQQRFREKMKEEGKRQRVFFLSDAAMDRVRIWKEESNSQSMNHALESLLVAKQTEHKIESPQTTNGSLPTQKNEPETPEKTQISEPEKSVPEEFFEIVQLARRCSDLRSEVTGNKYLTDDQRSAIKEKYNAELLRMFNLANSMP